MHYQEINMVQELGYESCAMFPGPRQGSFNMNLGPFSYAPQQTGFGQEYGQFNLDTSTGLQQSGSPCSWAAGMYSGSPVSGRAGSAGLVDEWAQYCPTQSPGPQGGSPPGTYNYRGTYGGLPSDYPTSSMHQLSHPSSMGPVLSDSPSPTPSGHGYHQVPVSGPQSAVSPRQTRAPYDWMKKQALPITPSNERRRLLLRDKLDRADLKWSNRSAYKEGKTRTKDKYRVVYTDHQRLELEKEFHYSRYITIRRKAELAQNLSLSERQVKIWFQNRRAKERKQNKKKDETSSGGKNAVVTGSADSSLQQMTPPGLQLMTSTSMPTQHSMTSPNMGHHHPHLITPIKTESMTSPQDNQGVVLTSLHSMPSHMTSHHMTSHLHQSHLS